MTIGQKLGKEKFDEMFTIIDVVLILIIIVEAIMLCLAISNNHDYEELFDMSQNTNDLYEYIVKSCAKDIDELKNENDDLKKEIDILKGESKNVTK